MPPKNSTPPIVLSCQQCGKEFRVWPSTLKKGGGKFCCHTCYGLSLRVENKQSRAAINERYNASDKGKETARTWRAEHGESRREAGRAWRAANADVLAAGKKRWATENRERVRAAAKRHRDERRIAMIAAYGGRCACCGESEPTFLTLDHIGGGGAAERRSQGVRGNQLVIARLCREGWPKDGYRLLCWNCQWGVLQPGGCPHQRSA